MINRILPHLRRLILLRRIAVVRIGTVFGAMGLLSNGGF
nr:MAG TPA: hypothetical protein [Caudoviricetes sp.]